MITIKPASDPRNEFNYRMIDQETEQDNEKDQTATSSRERSAICVEFDLFVEARRIYARARAGRRVRSSNII
jgi:hypothetical protein